MRRKDNARNPVQNRDQLTPAKGRWTSNILLTLLVLTCKPPAACADSTAYSQLLAANVRPGKIGNVTLNLVRYADLRNDPLYQQAVKDLASADAEALATEAERFAFWINAYNLLAIKTVVEHYPIASIRDVGGFFSPVWKQPAGIVAGKPYSLDEIEHGILRPRFHDPRVHFAVVCASVSCPDLRAEAYTGSRLSEQLNDAARRFLENPAKGVVVENGSVSVSSIFRWFGDDFETGGGVLAFIRAEASPALVTELGNFKDSGLSWIDYDWSLNDAARDDVARGRNPQ